jgi:hypothetical protein
VSGEDIYIYYLTARGWGGPGYQGVYRSVVAVKTRGEALAEAQHCRVCVEGGYPFSGLATTARGVLFSIGVDDTKEISASIVGYGAKRFGYTHRGFAQHGLCVLRPLEHPE